MDQYFNEVVKSLTIEDTMILGVLKDNEATSKQRSIKVNMVQKMSESTEAKFRKSIDRLTALQFVVPNKDYKEHGLFISHYGLHALQNILTNMGE